MQRADAMADDRAARTGGEFTHSEDAELIERFRRGEREAFTDLVRRWQGPVYRIAYRIVGDSGEAEDVREVVFLRLLTRPGAVRHPERFAGWIRRSTVNAAISSIRSRERRRKREVRWRRNGNDDLTLEPEDSIQSGEEASRLREALARLDPEDRALLALRYEEELSFSDIARAVGLPVTTVKSRVGKATERLRKTLSC